MKGLIKTLEERKHQLELRKKDIESELSDILKELSSIYELLSLHSDVKQYPMLGSTKDKIVFILSVVGSASYRTIADEMSKHGDSVNLNTIKITCASLARSGEIKVSSKVGTSYIYSL